MFRVPTPSCLISQTIFVYLACLLFALLMAPAEAAPAPAPAPVNLESLLLAKLLFLKGYLVGQYLHTQNH